MAPILINRAPWNALIDDSGNNLDGSLWDKAAIKSVLLDPIDVALADVDDGTTKDAAQDTLITNNANAIGLINAGPWSNVPYAATNFKVVQGTGVWTVTAGNQGSYCWLKLTPYTVLVQFFISASNLTGSNVALGIVLPAGLPAASPPRNTGTTFHFYGSAQTGMGVMLTEAGSPNIRLLRDIGGTPFVADTSLYVIGQLVIPF